MILHDLQKLQGWGHMNFNGDHVDVKNRIITNAFKWPKICEIKQSVSTQLE